MGKRTSSKTHGLTFRAHARRMPTQIRRVESFEEGTGRMCDGIPEEDDHGENEEHVSRAWRTL